MSPFNIQVALFPSVMIYFLYPWHIARRSRFHHGVHRPFQFFLFSVFVTDFFSEQHLFVYRPSRIFSFLCSTLLRGGVSSSPPLSAEKGNRGPEQQTGKKRGVILLTEALFPFLPRPVPLFPRWPRRDPFVKREGASLKVSFLSATHLSKKTIHFKEKLSPLA